MRRGILTGTVAAAATAFFLWIQWLRWPEPPGLDQSLFVLYGKWIGHGLAPYRDLWDTKPPGLFAVYAVGHAAAGLVHAPRLLDAIAGAASGVLAFRLVRGERAPHSPRETRAAGRVLGAWVTGLLAALLPSAPLFGGPRVAGQPEVLGAPLLLGAALAARSGRLWAGPLAGVLLGFAACLKISFVLLFPLAWLFAPVALRKSARYSALVLLGWLLPVIACGVWMVWHGSLLDGVHAVLVFPREYAAEIAARIPLGPTLARGVTGLASGFPFVLALAALGAVAPPRRRLAGRALVWLGLSLAGAIAQRQLVDYQLFTISTPLALLAGGGAGWWWSKLVGLSGGAERRMRAGVVVAACFVVLQFLAAVEVRGWTRHYATHAAHRRGDIDRDTFLLTFGRPGLMWVEAEKLAEVMRGARRQDAEPSREAILVWGLAPAVYALSGAQPATRFAFHQTLLVRGSALAAKWPDVEERRAELVSRLQAAPPRFVVVVHGDRSGLEPLDSAAELREFPELAAILERDYRRLATTRSYELYVRTRS